MSQTGLLHQWHPITAPHWNSVNSLGRPILSQMLVKADCMARCVFIFTKEKMKLQVIPGTFVFVTVAVFSTCGQNKSILELRWDSSVIDHLLITAPKSSIKVSTYLSDIPKQLPFPCKQGVVCKASPPCYSHALACCVYGCKLYKHTQTSVRYTKHQFQVLTQKTSNSIKLKTVLTGFATSLMTFF